MSSAVASKAPAVIEKLLELWPDAVGPEVIERRTGYPVEVHEGWPGDVIGADTVVIGNHTSDQAERSLGARHRSEIITVDVEVLVIRDTAGECRSAAYEIADALSAWARTTTGLTVDGAVCQSRFQPVRYQAGLTAAGRSGWLHCTVVAKFDRLT